MAERKALNGPVDPKIVYSSGGAAVTGLVLWLLAEYVFNGGVPEAVAGFAAFIIPGLVAAVAGWYKTTPFATLRQRVDAADQRRSANQPEE